MRVLEVLVSLTVGLLLLGLGWGMLARAAVTGRVLVERSAALETARLAPAVLEAELAGARPLDDWSASPEGISVRAYRGLGIACAPPAPSIPSEPARAWVAYRGLRRPDATKDSLELVYADGRAEVVLLVASGAPGPVDGAPACGDTAIRLDWEASGASSGWAPAPLIAARVFERGVYSVDDALRYRRGAGGRQPLTAAVLDPSVSSFEAGGDAPELRLGAPGVSARARIFVWSGPR